MAIRDLLVRIRGDSTEVDRELLRTSRSIRKFGRDMSQLGTTLNTRVTLPILAVGAASLKIASDAEESEAKFRAVFQNLAGDARAWSEDIARQLGRSATEIRTFLSAAQDTFVPLGFARDAASELSKSVAGLTLDLAAFHNASEPETIQLLTSALVGNHTAVRRFGVVLSEATLAAELARMGIEGGTRAATEQEKVLARWNVILAQTADAHGTAAREAEGAASGWRGLTAAFKDAGLRIGEELLPAANALQRWVTGIVRQIQDLDSNTLQWTIALAGVTAVLGPLTAGLGLLAAGLAAVTTALGVGLLPLIVVGGPILIGLGLIAAAFVKSKLAAMDAAGELDRYRAALSDLTKDQLLHQQAVQTIELFDVTDAIAQLEAIQEAGGTLSTAQQTELLRLNTLADHIIRKGVAISEAIGALQGTAGGPATGGGSAATSGVSKVLEKLTEDLRVMNEQAKLAATAFSGDGAGDRGNRALANRARALRLAREEAEAYRRAITGLLEAGLNADAPEVQELENRRRDAVLRGLSGPGKATEFGGFALEPLRELPPLIALVSSRTRYAVEEASRWAGALSRVADIGVSFAASFGTALADATRDGAAAFRRFADYAIDQILRVAAQFAVFQALSFLFPGSGLVSALGSALGFAEPATAAVGAVNAGAAFRGVAGPSMALQLDLSRLPPAADPRQSARDGAWLRWLSTSLEELDR